MRRGLSIDDFSAGGNFGCLPARTAVRASSSLDHGERGSHSAHSFAFVDLSLTANLLLIVIFAGYENFVSKIHVSDGEDRPAWMGTVDFSGLKIKLIASIVAISAIALLRVFLPLGDAGAPVDSERVHWLVVIHLTFVVSGVLLAAMDWIASRIKAH
jgi:uncharacterized protein (TIGR00645 family)